MNEFLKLSSSSDAIKFLMDNLPNRKPEAEEIETSQSLGRILIEDVFSLKPLPEFSRSSVDGYAVRASDTFGASDTLPGYLAKVGDILMGESPTTKIKKGTCARIHTGGMLPEGADAVIMQEHTQIINNLGENKINIGASNWGNGGDIEILRSVSVGENVLLKGEDVSEGQIVLKAGKKIRPADIGGCMALGRTTIRVATKPIFGIISSGDEVIPTTQVPNPGQVRDVNSFTLGSLISQAGGIPVLYGIVPDNLDLLINTAKSAHKECDAIIISAGSSAGSRDKTADAISSLGKPGILVHGINIRPGKPTILAISDGKPVFGLPGNPVSALLIARLFIVPVVEKMLGAKEEINATVMAKLTVNVSSQAGREDWVAVKLSKKNREDHENGATEWIAEPVFGKSNYIFSLSTADGLMRIEEEKTGINAEEVVEVILL